MQHYSFYRCTAAITGAGHRSTGCRFSAKTVTASEPSSTDEYALNTRKCTSIYPVPCADLGYFTAAIAAATFAAATDAVAAGADAADAADIAGTVLQRAKFLVGHRIQSRGCRGPYVGVWRDPRFQRWLTRKRTTQGSRKQDAGATITSPDAPPGVGCDNITFLKPYCNTF